MADSEIEQHVDERLFKCWRCSSERPWFSFPLIEHEGSFEHVLEYYINGNPPCCISCQFELVYLKRPRNTELRV